eukprot:CAMPEP_0183354788 /NCGR_PEP_ID=MMETSP0164_2-20130417/38142_1 /TAXON_ID=221442 /ORGANISM="Coccolithus pelagicus ssp braarudi, Strain PLY182g" /LENGTH=153 /DNA_ID=CAMNT_0025527735 /DNA_START=63 /DNA_END=524 /DNA_ORIENTATION=-
MFDSLKASAKAGADATARAAKTTKMKGEVLLLEQKITSAKKDFGKAVYDAMFASDRALTEELFNATRLKIDGMKQEIAAKHAEMELLKSSSAQKTGGAQAAQTAWAPPPPGPPPPPPMGLPALPPGWQKAATPEGKDYYYHETTGETSWTPPQ